MAKLYTVDNEGIHFIEEPKHTFDPIKFYMRQQAWLDRKAVQVAAKKQAMPA